MTVTGVMTEASQGYVNPPVFSVTKPYDRWKIEVEAWTKVSKLPKNQQGVAVALSFPEGSLVRDKVFSEVDIGTLDAEDGITKLLEFLDHVYLKDELVRAYEAWSEFDSYRKSVKSTMEDYIMEYRKLYSKVKKYGSTEISEPILAFKMLDCAGLTKKERQLVVTGVDFSKKDKLLEQVSTSLIKFFGKSTVTLPCDNESSVTIKEELGTADTLIVNPSTKWRSNWTRRDGVAGSVQRGRDRSSNTTTAADDNWRSNARDVRGRPTRCYICGSMYHYARRCPERRQQQVLEAEVARTAISLGESSATENECQNI